jgi:membrane-bound lytic murein transglycosylase B
MQFIPSTWAAYGLGGDVHDPHDAVMGAANYLHARAGNADGLGREWLMRAAGHEVGGSQPSGGLLDASTYFQAFGVATRRNQ